MALEQIGRGSAIPRSQYTATQRATVEFFKSRECRSIQGSVIAAGALIPWLIAGVSRLLNSAPILARDVPVPFWAMCGIGFVDATRGRWLAFYWLAGRFIRSWDQIRSKAGQTAIVGA